MGLDIWFNKIKKEELGYFRKVNFLVKYFHELGMNVKDQVPFYMEKEDIVNLLDRCNKVLEDRTKAEELLPTMEGFFFGNTEYNEYYFEDVEAVKDFITNKLLPQFDNLDNGESITFDIWY